MQKIHAHQARSGARLAVLALALGGLLSFASPGSASVSGLDSANLGEHWYGPERTLETLKGHVVLWENWGYN